MSTGSFGDKSRAAAAGWIAPVALFVLACAVYVPLSLKQAIPLVAPDEQLYARLARSLANGEGLSLYGQHHNWPTPLYIYLLTPSWLIASGTDAYELAKATGTVAACTVVLPVWLLSRRLIPGPLAILPATLTVAGTWMAATGGLLSENLAFPLTTAALTAGVFWLHDRSDRWFWIATGLGIAATLSRAQSAVVFAILAAALLLDAAFADNASERLASRRKPLVFLGTLLGVGLIAFLAGSDSLLGPYREVADYGLPLGDVLQQAGKQWIALTVSCGVVPLAIVLTAASSRSGWIDRDLGPLLAVTAPTVVLLVLQSAYFNAGLGGGIAWSIERYLQYAMPLLFVAAVAALAKRAVPVARLAIIGSATALALIGTPSIRQAIEERAQFATWRRVDDLVGADPWLALTAVGLILVAVTVWLVRRWPPRRTALGVSSVVFAVLIIQSQAIWNWQLDFATATRDQYPAQLDWVDQRAGGPTSRMYFLQNSPLSDAAAIFNEDVDQVLMPPIPTAGKPPLAGCNWAIGARGELTVGAPCRGGIRSRIWNDDPFVELSVHGGRTLARDPFLGQVIAVPREPRLQSVIRKPCQRATIAGGRDGSPVGIPRDVRCTPYFSVNLWVDSPGKLELTLDGGRRTQHVRQGAHSWTLPAGRPTRIQVPVNSAIASLIFATDWNHSAGTPRIAQAAFVSAAGSQSLL